MTRRVAIYARYSSDRQKPTSIDDQVALGRKFCEERGWPVVAVHTDAEMTGKNNRPPVSRPCGRTSARAASTSSSSRRSIV